MKKVFLATSFSHKIDEATGLVLPEFRKEIETILEALRKTGDLEVFCAVEDEDWRMGEGLPEVGVRHDLDQIEASDVMLALVEDSASAGVQFELGYAVAKGKQVVVAVRAGVKAAYFNQGVISNGLMTLVTFDNVSSLVRQLDVALHAPAEDLQP
jgi:nucleoside 2-deoxyribosyltransferase